MRNIGPQWRKRVFLHTIYLLVAVFNASCVVSIHDGTIQLRHLHPTSVAAPPALPTRGRSTRAKRVEKRIGTMPVPKSQSGKNRQHSNQAL